jgi:PII-like signaling protein
VIEDGWKLTSFFGEREKTDGRFVSDVLLDTFASVGVSTSVVFRAAAGFGLKHHLRTDETLSLSEDPSVVVVAVDGPDRIARLLERVQRVQPAGVLCLERVRLLRPGRHLPHEAGSGPADAIRLTAYVGRHDRVAGERAHVAVVRLLQDHGVAGATVLAAVDGTVRGIRERARFFGGNADVPTMVTAMGSVESVQRALPALHDLLPLPAVTVERARICKRDGQLYGRPHGLADVDAGGRPRWQKLTVFSSEARLHEGVPVHRALVRRLRAADARGATAIRGVWGYHGDHAPHGDRFWQLGRRVPVVTVLIDRPSRIAELFDVVDELTADHGLVTSELVPALRHVPDDEPLRLEALGH